MKEFHEDLAKEFCMENDSREDEIFEMAKEHGKLVEKECEHKFDFMCAYKYYGKLCKLIKNEKGHCYKGNDLFF